MQYSIFQATSSSLLVRGYNPRDFTSVFCFVSFSSTSGGDAGVFPFQVNFQPNVSMFSGSPVYSLTFSSNGNLVTVFSTDIDPNIGFFGNPSTGNDLADIQLLISNFNSLTNSPFSIFSASGGTQNFDSSSRVWIGTDYNFIVNTGTATITPNWTSSDTTIFTVDPDLGTLTPVAVGSAYLTCTNTALGSAIVFSQLIVVAG